MRALSVPVNQADLEALAFQQDLTLHAHHSFQSGYNKQPQDRAFRNRSVFCVYPFTPFLSPNIEVLVDICHVSMLDRPQRVNRSPGPQPAGRNSPGNAVTSMVSKNLAV